MKPKRKHRKKPTTAPQTPPALNPWLQRDWFDVVLEARAKEGRPDAEIDLALVEKLAALMCTDAEIASICNVSRATIARRKKTASFREILERGRNAGRASLRRRQMAAAEGGNVTAQIWLGKQYLGQKDNVTHEYGLTAGAAGAFESALDRVFARLDRHAATATDGSI